MGLALEIAPFTEYISGQINAIPDKLDSGLGGGVEFLTESHRGIYILL